MASTITVDLSGLADRLRRMAAGATRRLNLQGATRPVALYLAAQAKRCFVEGKAPDGTPWAPLKNPSKRRGGASAKPLRDTGALMASLGSGQGNVRVGTAHGLLFGTNVSYAGFHQEGTRQIPARPFLGVTPARESRIAEIVLEWVQKRLLG